MIVHGRPMRTPWYTYEQAMETTMLRRSIKDDSVNVNKVSNVLGYEYSSYGKPSPTYTVKSKDSYKSGG